jgi:LPS export ABC transporter protein LptC
VRRAPLRAALAFGALALAGCPSGKEPPVTATRSLADTADQTMYSAHSIITDQGMRRAELFSDSAFFFDDNTRVEMRGVRTTFYTTDGRKNAVLTSGEGTYRTRGGAMAARVDVVVVSEDGRRLTTPSLTFDPTRNEIASDSAFVLTEADRRLEGIGFRSDPNVTNFRCLAACKGLAGTVNLPQETAPAPPGSRAPAPVAPAAPAVRDSAAKRPPVPPAPATSTPPAKPGVRTPPRELPPD